MPEAFEEWAFTNEVIDHEKPVETCQMCEQEQLRYHFKIRNVHTAKVLWVGSQCILKFGLSVFEDSLRLSKQQAKKKLDRLTQQMRFDSCIKVLQRLAKAENNEILRNAVSYYSKNKCLTPKQAFVVLWRLQTKLIILLRSLRSACKNRNTKMICVIWNPAKCGLYGLHYPPPKKGWQKSLVIRLPPLCNTPFHWRAHVDER